MPSPSSVSDSKAGYTPLGSTAAPTAAVVVDAVAVPATDRVEVVAPATLPGNYELHCDFQGRPVVVRVPPEGVQQGEKFIAAVIRQPPGALSGASGEGGGHRIPTGRWRDGCCDCFRHGLCHPILCLACWCHPLALGQVMTRMKLSGTGSIIPADQRQTYWSAFKVLAVVFILYLGLSQMLEVLQQPYAEQMQYTIDDEGNLVPPDYSNIPGWVWIVVSVRSGLQFFFWIYMMVLIIRTRATIRQRYDIPETTCRGCEDCCCAFWVPCCTTLQMARHTVDYDTYQAACCTETGLPPHAPQVV